MGKVSKVEKQIGSELRTQLNKVVRGIALRMEMKFSDVWHIVKRNAGYDHCDLDYMTPRQMAELLACAIKTAQLANQTYEEREARLKSSSLTTPQAIAANGLPRLEDLLPPCPPPIEVPETTLRR